MAHKDFTEERRKKILDYLNSKERADITELAVMLSATEATVRRDLSQLEGEGKLVRTHGGAIKKESKSVWQTTSVSLRSTLCTEEKRRIADFAASLVQNGESLMIDGGSTTLLFAERLKAKDSLLVMTNSPALADLLVGGEHNKIMITGGEYLKDTQSISGSETNRQLMDYFVDKAVIGITGILPDRGCFAAIPSEAETKRIMVQHARESILLADSSKIGVHGLCKAFDISSINILVTDKGIAEKDLSALVELGVKVYAV